VESIDGEKRERDERERFAFCFFFLFFGVSILRSEMINDGPVFFLSSSFTKASSFLPL
jgi:hypothetical protein